jgi:hypothetical protein
MDETTRRAAHEDLQYIRRTLAASGHLSIVPGWGLVTIGLLALAAVLVNLRFTGAPWEVSRAGGVTESRGAFAGNTAALGVWAALLVLSLAVGVWTMSRKARRTGQVLWSPVLRKALWGYSAAMVLGGLLTFSLLDYPQLYPEIWLGCYGVGLISAGTVSVSPVRWMGACFLVLAAAAGFAPASMQLLLLGLGFGWLHISFGAYIAWRHDG